jgi:hypothetical protein
MFGGSSQPPGTPLNISEDMSCFSRVIQSCAPQYSLARLHCFIACNDYYYEQSGKDHSKHTTSRVGIPTPQAVRLYYV